MILPKEVVENVCSKCEMWKTGPFLNYKQSYCHGYARDCDNLVDYAISNAVRRNERSRKGLEERMMRS